MKDHGGDPSPSTFPVPQPLRESVPARHDDGPDDRFAIYLQLRDELQHCVALARELNRPELNRADLASTAAILARAAARVSATAARFAELNA